MSQQQTIKRNTGAFVFYVFEFTLSALAVIFAATTYLVFPKYCAVNPASGVCIVMKEFGVVGVKQIVILLSYTILYGLGAFKKDFLLTGSVPLKLAPLILVPWAANLITDIMNSPTPQLDPVNGVAVAFRNIPVLLYFILSFWDAALPYSYVK